MSEETTGTTTNTTPPVPPTGGTMTRDQHRRNTAAAEQDAAIEDSEKSTMTKKKEKEAFRGKIEKMDGNVFQLPEEGRKGNQFTQTLEALENYATIEYEHAKDLGPLFESPSREATLDEPPDLPPMSSDGTTRVTRDHRKYIVWKFECENHNTRTITLASNQHKLFTVTLLQCSQSVKNKLESTTGYEVAKMDDDCFWLFKSLKNICHKFEHTENRFVALVNAKAAIFNCRQGQTQTTPDYYETFKELVSILESYGGQLHDPDTAAPESTEDLFATLTPEERDTYMRDRYYAALYLRNADSNRYDALKTELSHDFGKGRNEYPTTITEAHQLLLKRAPPATKKQPPPTNQRPHHGGRGNQSGRGPNPGRTVPTGPSPGRGAPSGATVGKTFVQVALCLAQVENHFANGIPDHYVLLDSDSTVSIFCNPNLLVDIHEVDVPLYLETNGGGYQVSTQMGTVPDFGPVWYNPESIANVLSLAQVRRLRRVTMDSDSSPAFHVHKLDGSGTTMFTKHESGLYLYDASMPIGDPNDTNASIFAYSCLQTVAHNKTKFTARQVDAADEARKLYRLLGRPGYTRFLTTLRENHILNCPITVDDARRAECIYGQDVAFLKGKTTDSPAKSHVPDFTPVNLPSDLLSLHPNVTFCLDLFYVLGLGFSLSTSRSLRYLSSQHISDRTRPNITACVAADLSTYRARGFTPTAIHADNEFSLQQVFPDIHFSICSADDHVPEIERAVRTVKESIRATIHGMPYARLPRVLVKALVTHATRTLNMLPHPDGVSSTMSPATIVTGQPKTDFRTLSLEFGTYVQVYDGTSNDTKSRTLGAIATNPTGNSSGDYYFMSLATGERIHRRSWTVLPISDAVISRVEEIALNEKMPPVDNDNHMLHEFDPDAVIDPSEYDRNYAPPITDPESDNNLTSDAYTDESESDDDSFGDEGHHPDFDDDGPIIPAPVRVPHTVTQPTPLPSGDEGNPRGPLDPTTLQASDIEAQPTTVDTVEEEERPTIDVSTVETVEEEERPAIDASIDTSTVERVGEEERPSLPRHPGLRPPKPVETRRPGLRPPKPVDFQHRFNFSQIHQCNKEVAQSWGANQHAIESMPLPGLDSEPFTAPQMQSIHKAITGLMFTQMSANKGIKKFGQSALDALRKEFLQFRALEVLEPLDAFTLTDEQKAEALRSISVIKEKRDGTLKGRTCADGSSQQGKFSKSETGSPTIANDALFLTVMTDAFEERDVGTADVGGAYLHAYMKQFISMRFVGWAVDLLCDVNPEYAKFVVYEGKTKVLYVRCNKAIYGCVVSGVLWYELFSETLEQQGFTVNPYDFCVANAIIDGSQCTVGWFVDDTKISHVKPSVVTKIINMLEARFGRMTVTRGRVHKFLGMTITYLGDGTATVHMPSYITEAIDESGLDVSKSAKTPCSNALLFIDETSPLLSVPSAKRFHSIVAKLIYVGTRARTDILLALSFLCGRVSAPTEQDKLKLKRLLSYLKCTIDLKLRIGADSLSHFATWVDASFAVHPDMRSHTGGVISFGRGGLICKSKKQSINTKSSTEAELVGASDYLPHTLYVKMFMEAQGYPIRCATFHQDNESAIKMEQNGKASCGQRSRHIDIRYFFITDHSKRNCINITHCPTEDMLADFFTKPLQGSLFRKFRSVLLGEAHIDSLSNVPLSSPNAERVEGKNVPSVLSDTHISPALKVPASYRLTTSSSNSAPVINSTSHSIEKYPEDNNI
jgi:hypothetical protein